MQNERTARMKIDAVFKLCFTGYPDRAARLDGALDPALRALGVPCCAINRIWQFPSPFDAWYCSKVPHEFELSTTRKGCVSAGFGHYRAMKTAYELGMERILIVEDDCRFLKDADAVARGVDMAPADADLLFLDHTSKTREPLRSVENGWQRCGLVYSAACYILNRKGMERLIEMHESTVSGKYRNPVLRICDHWQDQRCIGDAKMYRAMPNLAIQCICPGPTNCGAAHLTNAYEKLGLDLSLYDTF